MWTSDDEYFSPIEQAIVLGTLEDFKLALDAGIDGDALNQAVIDTAAYGNVEMLCILHERGADLRVRNGAALIVAAGNGHDAVCTFMMDQCHGKGLMYAVDDVNMALRQAIDALCPDPKNVRLHHTKRKVDEAPYLRIVERLLEAGANAHLKDSSIMSRACYRGPLALVDLLLKSGVDLELNGTVFLRSAEWRGDPSVLERLFDAGLNPYDTPGLSLACSLFDARALRSDLETSETSQEAQVRPAFRRTCL